MIRTRRHLRVLLIAALTLSACGGASEGGSTAAPAKNSTGTDGAADTSPKTTDGGASPGAGHELLAFSAPAIGGGSVNGVEFRGRPTLLWFWSPW